ncbi:MAG: DUF3025 domain-containing protein [Xanthomonadales bacterium]|nr:DUF3025 domain-containing protein [Xanthomonadales bacterium]MCC6560308.1 DUF3025 domain-containing protein [Xanthomonadales bacterium]
MKRRYLAPAREATSAATFAPPAFAGYASLKQWLLQPAWPDLGALNAGFGERRHAATGKPLRFVAQTPELLADGLHYEARIFERGEIATRERNWHDLLNAMVWCRFPQIKAALNGRQYQDLLRVGAKRRTPAQYAQTLFDEGGVIVTLRDAALLPIWDAHGWSELFQPVHWQDGALRIEVFGHALLEHALTAGRLMTAKCLVWCGDDAGFDTGTATADAIRGGRWLNDPQELRPLPVSGIPGWHGIQDESFYASAECFRPARPGRVYPTPLDQAAFNP